jgi:hypothetical protein
MNINSLMVGAERSGKHKHSICNFPPGADSGLGLIVWSAAWAQII